MRQIYSQRKTATPDLILNLFASESVASNTSGYHTICCIECLAILELYLSRSTFDFRSVVFCVCTCIYHACLLVLSRHFNHLGSPWMAQRQLID